MAFSPIILAAAMAGSIYCAASFGAFVPLCAAGVFVMIFLLRSVSERRVNMTALVLALGAAAGIISHFVSASSYIHKSTGLIGRYAVCRGVIISSARESQAGDSYSYTLRVKELTSAGDTIKDNENILLSTPKKFACGDTVEVRGIVKALPGQMNEGGFDAAGYYRSQNIFTKMYSADAAVSDERLRVLAPSVVCGRFRDAVDNIIYKYYYGNSAAVLSAILTGGVHRFTDDYSGAVSSAGFKRLFHPAYIHITLILSFIGLFASRVPKKFRAGAAAALIGLLALFNCAQIGFCRAAAACALTSVFRGKNGAAHFPDTLAWIVIVCAPAAPMLLFNASLILSIAAALIVWAFMPFAKTLFRAAPGRLRSSLPALLVCAVFFTPLTAYYFSGVCPYSVLLPLVTAPAVLTALFAAPPAFIMLRLFGTAPIVKPILDFSIWIMLKLPPLISSLPFSRIIMKKPSLTELAAVLALILAAYWFLKERRRQAGQALLVSCALGLSVALSSLFRAGTADFMFVNVGQGDAAVIHTALGSVVIIDGGGGTSYSDYDPGESVFVPYLESKGFGSVDAAFVSHFHQDHVQGVIDAVRALDVKAVFAPAPTGGEDEEMRKWAAKLDAAARERGTSVYYISENTAVKFEKGLVIKILVPSETVRTSGDGNDTSLLIKASFGDFDALYTGDMTELSERGFLRSGAEVDAEVLKVAHHGSSTSTCREWVGAVSPDLSIISCGENNPYGHPSEQTLANLRGSTVLRTDLNGGIRVTADKNGMEKVHILK